MRKLLFLTIIFAFAVAPAISQTLQFSRVLLVGTSTETVPSGKVWKLENILYETKTWTQPSSGSGQCSQPCNGSTQIWTSYSTQNCIPANTAPVVINGVACSFSNTGSPVWLPAGTTVAGTSRTCTTQGYLSNCSSCPSPVTAVAWVSVIEFTVIP